MKKFRVFLDLNREEDWINAVQATGYRLTRVNSYFHYYTFQPLVATDQFNPYTRLDFRDKWMSRRNYQNYRQFFSDSGWRLIAGGRHGGIQYFQQKAATSDRDIFSDEHSKLSCRQRSSRYSALCGVLFLLYVFYILKMMSNVNIFDVKSWYLTPGLWQMQGDLLWKAILFETPFALLRVLPVFLFLIVGIYYLCRAIDGYHR
ncbi:DUF2812 domain-containing protein [Levilactobacillus enshiensis]|uniref:DUF2812 domain-containing protein n=1 Tax=Levilactobacillus enshiensis TaxID=2590213 RepID=UPI00117A2BA5|nr:DUF2812 domain-containing protein [Levilactobacillus enshiensis]